MPASRTMPAHMVGTLVRLRAQLLSCAPVVLLSTSCSYHHQAHVRTMSAQDPVSATAAPAAEPGEQMEAAEQPAVTDASAPLKCGPWVTNESQLACHTCQGAFTVINR
jgi:hypothetical protein